MIRVFNTKTWRHPGVALLLISLHWLLAMPFASAQWIEQVPILQASDEMDNLGFGSSVAVDGNVAVVGAHQHPSGGGNRGQAYVFRFNGSTWAEEQILQASDEVDGAYFGNRVAVSGDVIVVGANIHSSGGFQRGQAYVFRYSGATWVEEQILQASDETNSAFFGNAVATDGAVVAVGAWRHPSGGFERGQAYIYRWGGASWTEEQILQASDEADSAYFGLSIGVSGNAAVVGADHHPSGGTNRGQAYIYRFNGATWIEEEVLQASDEVNGARFGNDVAISGAAALIGAYTHPSGGSGRGQAYVFRYDGLNWAEEQVLQASDETNSAWFGYSVALDGNLGVIGAHTHPSGGSQRGQAYVFRNFGPSWTQEQILQASDEVNLARMGRSVGAEELQGVAIVSAPEHPSGGTFRGQSYIFSGPTPTPSPSPTPSSTPTASASPTSSPSPTPNVVMDWTIFE